MRRPHNACRFLAGRIASVSSESRRLGGLNLSRMCGRDSSDTMLECSLYSPLAIRSCRLHCARVSLRCPSAVSSVWSAPRRALMGGGWSAEACNMQHSYLHHAGAPGLHPGHPLAHGGDETAGGRQPGEVAVDYQAPKPVSLSGDRPIDRRNLHSSPGRHRRVLRHRCKAPVFDDTAGNGRNRQPDRSAAAVGLSSSSDASELAAVESFLSRGVREASARKVQRIDEPVFRERVIPARTGAEADGSKDGAHAHVS